MDWHKIHLTHEGRGRYLRWYVWPANTLLLPIGPFWTWEAAKSFVWELVKKGTTNNG